MTDPGSKHASPAASLEMKFKQRELEAKTPNVPLIQQSLRKQSLFLSQRMENKTAVENNKENCHSETKYRELSNSSLSTPHQHPASIQGIRKRLDHHFSSSSSSCCRSLGGQQVSPGLAKIQNTPGTLKKKRQELIIKHKDIQDRSDELGVGGGVTLWPEMEVVRMTTTDVLRLLSLAGILSLFTVIVFYKIHGWTFVYLQKFSQKIQAGCDNHKIIMINESTLLLNNEVIQWHKFLLHETEVVKNYFSVPVSLSQCFLYFVTYALGMSTLVYFLVDSMQAKNRLSPFRIKTWTCLLCVIGTWTVLMGVGLYMAVRLEYEAVKCVQQYASVLGHLVTASLDLSTYQSVLLYWRTCLLDNSSEGMIHVLGIMTLKDVIFYLQYYSIPIATVLLTPVVKLVISFWAVYGNGECVVSGNKST